jgi:hypothetical protein
MTGGSGIEALDEAIADVGEVGAPAEDHGAAAESGAGEARADRAGGHCGIHQAIERGATDAEPVAQAGVAGEQYLPEARWLVFAEGAYGSADAVRLGDHMEEGVAHEGR